MRKLPALLFAIASCDASVRLGSIVSEEQPDAAADAALDDATNANLDGSDSAISDSSPDASIPFDAGPLTTLATNMAGAEWIAVGANHVTWTTSGRSGGTGDLNAHYVAAKDGSNRIELSSEPGLFRGVLFDGLTINALRWIPPVSIIERATTAAPIKTRVGGVFLEGYGLAADDSFLYAAVTTKLARFEKNADGGTPTQIGSFLKAVALVSDGPTLYVADQGAHRIVRVDKSPENVPWSHDIGVAINDVAVDATLVYFAGAGHAGHVLKTGGGLEVFDLPGANALAIDASGIYYATTTSILRADLATPSVTTTLASGFVSLGRIALDANAVYFTDTGGGAVYRLEK